MVFFLLWACNSNKPQNMLDYAFEQQRTATNVNEVSVCATNGKKWIETAAKGTGIYPLCSFGVDFVRECMDLIMYRSPPKPRRQKMARQLRIMCNHPCHFERSNVG